jgi:hypothetical protein
MKDKVTSSLKKRLQGKSKVEQMKDKVTSSLKKRLQGKSKVEQMKDRVTNSLKRTGRKIKAGAGLGVAAYKANRAGLF